ncbi:MAG: hypothetical protein ACI37Q_03590 [Candidatus Gastranaerophilaceae bacterium]
MQIQNITPFTQNNYSSQRHNPNFTAIKSVKCEGLYKKYPELANELIEAFKQNPKAMDFCKRYDVDIIFHAMKQYRDSVQSSLHIFFDNISKSKTEKFFERLFGSNNDKIVLHSWGSGYSVPKSIEQSTKEMVESIILPERKVADGYCGGLLNAHIEATEAEIQKVLDEKASKLEKKLAKLQGKKDAEIKTQNAASDLENSIKDLIEKGNN